jgi:hypothetical protein
MSTIAISTLDSMLEPDNASAARESAADKPMPASEGPRKADSHPMMRRCCDQFTEKE